MIRSTQKDLIIAREKARLLEEEFLLFYAPTPTQLRCLQSPAKMKGLFGSNQAGKTLTGCVWLAWGAGKVDPYHQNRTGKVYVRDCTPSFSLMQTVLIPKYRSLLPRRPCKMNDRNWPGLLDYDFDKAFDKEMRTIYLADGSFIEIKSYDQDPDLFQGPPRHRIREDEEPKTERHHRENIARQITVGRDFMMTMTPLNYSRWVYSDVYQRAATDPTIENFHISIYENPYADPEVIRELEAIPDEAERAARLFGEFTWLSGRVFKEYDPSIHFVDPFLVPKEWVRILAIDPHPQKPTCVCCFALDPDNRLFMFYEKDIAGNVEQIVNEVRNDLAGHRIDHVIIDPSSKQGAGIHNVDPLRREKYTLFGEFKKYFPGIIAANNDVALGLDCVHKRLAPRPGTGVPDYMIFRTCPAANFQMLNAAWRPPTASGEDRSTPQIVKKNDERVDLVRYVSVFVKDYIGFGESNFEGFEIEIAR